MFFFYCNTIYVVINISLDLEHNVNNDDFNDTCLAVQVKNNNVIFIAFIRLSITSRRLYSNKCKYLQLSKRVQDINACTFEGFFFYQQEQLESAVCEENAVCTELMALPRDNFFSLKSCSCPNGYTCPDQPGTSTLPFGRGRW